jgi:hypothetical protein
MSKPSCLACQREDHQRCHNPRRVPVDDAYLSPGELMTVCCCAEAHEILERQVVVAYQVTHGHRPDGWWFTVEIPGRQREEHGPLQQRGRDARRQDRPHGGAGGRHRRAVTGIDKRIESSLYRGILTSLTCGSMLRIAYSCPKLPVTPGGPHGQNQGDPQPSHAANNRRGGSIRAARHQPPHRLRAHPSGTLPGAGSAGSAGGSRSRPRRCWSCSACATAPPPSPKPVRRRREPAASPQVTTRTLGPQPSTEPSASRVSEDARPRPRQTSTGAFLMYSNSRRGRPYGKSDPEVSQHTSSTTNRSVPHRGVIDLAAERRRRRQPQIQIRHLEPTVPVPCTGVCTCWQAPLGGSS